MTIENIYKFIDYKQITVYEFSKLCGLSNGYLSKQRASKGNISSHILQRILEQFPEIDAEWLITGKGRMLKHSKYLEGSENPSLSDTITSYNPSSKHFPTSNQNEKIFYASPALPGQPLYSKERLSSAIGSLKGFPHLSSSESLLPVIGYSMPPDIPEGCIIGIKQVHDLNNLNIEHTCLLVTNQECMVQKVKQNPKDTETIICSNNEGDAFNFEKSKLLELHRITAIIVPM